MEFNLSYLYASISVAIISSFTVSIGIGGGILYVPILGYIFSDISQGVHLSRFAVLVSSSLILTYHLYVDIYNGYKFYMLKKVNKTQNDEICDVENNVILQCPNPRVHVLLGASVVPWSIFGSYLGANLHHKSGDRLKVVFTLVVSSVLSYAIFKLIKENYLIKKYNNNNTSSDDGITSSNNNTKCQSSNEKIDQNGFTYYCKNFLKPYTIAEVNDPFTRIISFFCIILMVLCYYYSLEIENMFWVVSLRLVSIIISTWYLLKIRVALTEIPYVDDINKSNINVYDDINENVFHKIIRIFKINGIFHISLIFVSLFVTGILSGWVGIGGGIIIVPLLQSLELKPISCSATANILCVIIAIISTLNFKDTFHFNHIVLLTVILSSVLGTLTSVCLIRRFIKDKKSNNFINIVLSFVCIISIVLTWTIY